MKLTLSSLSLLASILLPLASSVNIGCDHIRVEKKKFDLSKIGGPHAVTVQDTNRPPAIYNSTWTLDICQPLVRNNDIPKEDQCPVGTHGAFPSSPSMSPVRSL